MPDLSMEDRRKLPKSDYVFPDKAPYHGSYPIPDITHARLALGYSHRLPPDKAKKVREKIYKKFPQLKKEE